MLKTIKRKTKQLLLSIKNALCVVRQFFKDITFTVKKYKLYGVNGVSTLYLPYYRTDYIQKTIYTDDTLS